MCYYVCGGNWALASSACMIGGRRPAETPVCYIVFNRSDHRLVKKYIRIGLGPEHPGPSIKNPL